MNISTPTSTAASSTMMPTRINVMYFFIVAFSLNVIYLTG